MADMAGMSDYVKMFIRKYFNTLLIMSISAVLASIYS